VASDVHEGYISPERAVDYGVVLNSPEGQVDMKATNALRQRLWEVRSSEHGAGGRDL
jgi:hypothetical protein